MAPALWLRDRVDCATEVDSSLGIVEVCQFTVIVDPYRDFSEHVGTAVVTILPIDFHIELHAGTAKKLIAFYSGQSVTIESE